MWQAVTAAILILGSVVGMAQEPTEDDGQVRLPLDTYNQLVDSSRHPVQIPRPAPAAFALGRASVTATVTDEEPRATADVSVELRLSALEDEWMGIPILPAGTPVESVTVNGSPVELLATGDGLVWSVRKAGSYTMSLRYRTDAARSEGGWNAAIPVPAAASIALNASIPGTDLDVSVIPAAGVRTRDQGDRTVVTATIPTTTGVQLVWSTPSKREHAISRARYSGQLAGNAIRWTGELSVDLLGAASATLPLLPTSTTLSGIDVDGEAAPIVIESGQFATVVSGRGRHTITVRFEVPVQHGDGPPQVTVQIPQVPVSAFELTLPGKKEVSVQPAGNVVSRTRGATTVATVNVPMGQRVTFSWSEAVPDTVEARLRTNASVYHLLRADEGILDVRALVQWEITRGEAASLRLAVPDTVQVNRIEAPSGAVADWRLEERDGQRLLEVFLDRQVSDQLLFTVAYDRSLTTGEEVPVPYLTVLDTQRQRGMVALLQGRELTLKPVAEGEATRVGENQLPAWVRQAVEDTVAHTFKYVETPPELVVTAATPERRQGRFDARVDTLASLGEVALDGSASVELNVKSGEIMELELQLPSGVNLLSLTGPSLRSHRLHTPEDGSAQRIDVQFTQEMEGQFRLEVAYERILADGEEAVQVPTVHVNGAEVEQGRIAVEATSAVEVQASTARQLSVVDIAELPQHLVLRTTNPILLAYKYVHADPPPELELTVTRHELAEVQEAAIDRAEYRTLFTRDGMAVTAVTFTVRNSRKQFLRVRLPEEAEIWSAFVDGQQEKPALGEGNSFLVKIINSTRGFPVQLVFAAPVPRVGRLGTIRATLPRPDILVTSSRWDVYLPDGVSYREPSSNMELLIAGDRSMPAELLDIKSRSGDQTPQQTIEPLKVAIPTTGVHYGFEKLYANQKDSEAWIAIPYASGAGAIAGTAVSVAGVLLLWLGALGWWQLVEPRPQRIALALGIIGILVLLVTVGLYGVSPWPAFWLTLLITLGLGWRWYRRSRWEPVEAASDDSSTASTPPPLSTQPPEPPTPDEPPEDG